MSAPQWHPGAPHGWPGQEAGGIPVAQRESWSCCLAPGGGGDDHSCYSVEELGHGAHQGPQVSDEEGEETQSGAFSACDIAATPQETPYTFSLSLKDKRLSFSSHLFPDLPSV